MGSDGFRQGLCGFHILYIRVSLGFVRIYFHGFLLLTSRDFNLLSRVSLVFARV